MKKSLYAYTKLLLDSIINKEHAMRNLNKYILSVITITIINGYICTYFMNKHKAIYHNYYETLVHEKQNLQNQLDEFYHYGIKVDVTMYQPTYYQTDKTPNITADGTKIRIDKASQYKFVALSRNLLKRWGGPFDYGDYILLKGASNKDGVYQVRDTMNAKWVNVVDILESKHVLPYKFEGCNIIKLPWAQENA
jgi:predicted SpoU family rRNA methylase